MESEKSKLKESERARERDRASDGGATEQYSIVGERRFMRYTIPIK